MSDRKRVLRWPALAVGVVLVTAIAFVSARTRTSSGNVKPDAAGRVAVPEASTHRVANVAAQENGTPRLQAQLITLRPFGFEPKQITRSEGRFLLMVDNRSGLREMSLRLDRVAGNRLHEVRVPRERLDWREFFELTPGRYTLTEANHPDWVCDITITPR